MMRKPAFGILVMMMMMMVPPSSSIIMILIGIYTTVVPDAIALRPSSWPQQQHEPQQEFLLTSKVSTPTINTVSSRSNTIRNMSETVGSRRQIMILGQLSLGIIFSSSSSSSVVANAVVEFATSAGRHNCTTQSDPSRTIVTCTGDVLDRSSFLSSSRLQSISSTENGVSTSAIHNPSAYMAPWSYLTETSDANKAWSSLTDAVSAIPGCHLVTVTTNYLHATVPTIIPPNIGLDDMEFVLRPEDRLVLFRSASQTSLFVYPLTQPVSDRETNRKRIDALRDKLGWQEFQ